MNGALRQVTEIAQQQRLLPVQLQFSRLLEMGDAELEMEVDKALNEMPALEVADSEENAVQSDFNETADELQRADYGSDEEMPFQQRRQPDWINDVTVEAEGSSLFDVLSEQLSALDLSGTDAEIGGEIIGNIDDNGYLSRSVSDLSLDLSIKLGVDVSDEDVERVLGMVQGMDPKGVGARDLRECLLLQLDARSDDDVDAERCRRVIAEQFDNVVKGRWDLIGRKLSLTDDDVDRLKAIIRSLNPKPGTEVAEGIYESQGKIINPDVEVRVDDGNAVVSLLSRVPELAVSSSFSLEGVKPGSADEAFIRSRRDEAAQFINVIKMRRDVLMAVTEAIVKLQRDYFLSGNEANLRPMVLKDVKAITGLDLSVISRATSGRYMLTPWGIEPMKRFFSERSVTADDGSDISGARVSTIIKQLIDGEDKTNPLSDARIAEMLLKDGMPVARRTVAKYRERMGYPVARLRMER
ncbi:MAG: RNA polymerase factor sigma-54 [Muribaculaceae bacterium]|nr:RNA polymerase factor sigma-54 [Muribaculaceae bacterium]